MSNRAVGMSYNAVGGLVVSHRADNSNATAALFADIATMNTDITAALANSTISGDATSTAAVTLIQTDFEALLVTLGSATAAISTVTGDITAALVVTAIAGDADATAAVALLQTDLNALHADLTASGASYDVLVSWKTTTVTSRNALQAALDAISRVSVGSADLA